MRATGAHMCILKQQRLFSLLAHGTDSRLQHYLGEAKKITITRTERGRKKIN